MRPLSAKLILTLVAVTCAVMAGRADAASLPAPHQVEIPAPNLTLHAQLYKPEGDGPFSTVIALHGCGGLGGHAEAVLPRYRDGFAVCRDS